MTTQKDQAPLSTRGAPAWLLASGLFVSATLLLGPLLHVGGTSVATMRQNVFLALGVHVLLSLYDGRFGRLRTATWLALFMVWSLSAAIGFLGYVLPWGQMAFWLAAKLTPIFGPDVFWGTWDDPAWRAIWSVLRIASAVLVLATPILDIAVFHAARIRRWSARKGLLFAVGIVVASFAMEDIARVAFVTPTPLAAPDPLLTPINIIPPADVVWAYVVLRAVPSKGWGVVAMFAFMVLPMVWPWARAWRFNARPTRVAWTLACLGLCACWQGLIFVGMQPPEDAIINWSRGLVLYDFVFFLVLPFVFAMFVPRETGLRAEVFE